MTNNIHNILKQQGRSQIWLANELNVTPETISMWCRNHHQPSTITLKYISILLNVEYNLLVI